MHIVLSIIIPTHNRADDLAENLSVLAPQCQGRPVEIIVVDSASDPDQAAAIAALQSTAPLRLIRLDRPGVSLARNAGVAQAEGAWLGFLDDDVVTAGDWVATALARIDSLCGKLGVVAGRVLPRWPQSPPVGAFAPSRLDQRSRVLMSIIEETHSYDTTDSPYGISANLLVRKVALMEIGGFPEGMGRIGASLASGEDPYVIDAIVRHGYTSWYDGTLCVEHKIHARQLTRTWLARRAWHEGMVSLRRRTSRRERLKLAAKCAASLPALALLRTCMFGSSSYVVRLHHNMGFLYGAVVSDDLDVTRSHGSNEPADGLVSQGQRGCIPPF